MHKNHAAASALSVLLVCAGALAAPPVLRAPAQIERPVVPRVCNTGPAPTIVQTPQFATYVNIAWLPVPGATQFRILRTDLTLNRTQSITPAGFQGIWTSDLHNAYSFWDSVPVPADTYSYTLQAFQANGCYGQAVLTAGPFQTPNPDHASGVRTGGTSAKLIWHHLLGTIAYRIDGPGMPADGFYFPVATYTPGLEPGMSMPSATYSLVADRTAMYWIYDMIVPVNNLGLGAADYFVTAIYPGNFADYIHRTQIHVPNVPQCQITSISPPVGPTGTLVTINGSGFQFTSSTTITFQGNPSHPWTLNHRIISPTVMTIDTSPPLLVAGQSLAIGTFRIHGPAGDCVSPPYTWVPPPPAPPAPKPVPGLQGDLLQTATAVLQSNGFTLGPVSGPNAPTAVVVSQMPVGGTRASVGSSVSVTTVAAQGAPNGASGIAHVSLSNYTDDQHSVNIWLLDGTTGQKSGGAALASQASTTVDLPAAHVYTIIAVDPTQCAGQDDPTNIHCDRWQVTVVGDPNGSTIVVSVN